MASDTADKVELVCQLIQWQAGPPPLLFMVDQDKRGGKLCELHEGRENTTGGEHARKQSPAPTLWYAGRHVPPFELSCQAQGLLPA